VTPEEAFAEYRKTQPTFDVKPAFMDGWRMGREATLREVEEVITARVSRDEGLISEFAKGCNYGVKVVLDDVRALLDRDA
jgi:hypothetical protein